MTVEQLTSIIRATWRKGVDPYNSAPTIGAVWQKRMRDRLRRLDNKLARMTGETR